MNICIKKYICGRCRSSVYLHIVSVSLFVFFGGLCSIKDMVDAAMRQHRNTGHVVRLFQLCKPCRRKRGRGRETTVQGKPS